MCIWPGLTLCDVSSVRKVGSAAGHKGDGTANTV